MAAAPVGDIYCDDRTHKETKNSVHFRDAIEMTVKGKTDPIQVFPVEHYSQYSEAFGSELSNTGYPAPYGCSDILVAVPLFGSVPKSNGSESSTHRALVVCGDSGTGKTMLINHVVQRHSIWCYKGSGDSMDTAVDFHAWRGIAKAIATTMVKASQSKASLRSVDLTGLNQNVATRVGDSTRLDVVRSDNLTVHRPIQHGWPSRTSILTAHEETHSDIESGVDIDTSFVDSYRPNLVEAASPNGQRVTVLDYLVMHQLATKATLRALRHWFPYEDTAIAPAQLTAEKGEEALKSFRQVLFSMIAIVSATKPIMLVFDDAQWMDNRSLSLVLKVLEELPNVNFLITVRGMLKHTGSARSMLLSLVMSLPSVETRQLECFTFQETSLFLCQQYHITIMDTEVLNFVFERTEGNPGSLVKLLNFMLDEKYIAIDPESNNIVVLKDLDEMDTMVPQHIRARVMSIVDSLDALAQIALKLLSINPQPTEENIFTGVLTLLSMSHQAETMHKISGIIVKAPLPTSKVSLLLQARESLIPCERALLTIDPHNKLYFFNTEEMRLVVYDTMLPSQRKVLHALYAEWLGCAAIKSGRASLIPPLLATVGSAPSKANLVMAAESPEMIPTMHPIPYQQYALLGYHLSQSGKPKEALEAYHLAAEGGMEAKELGFAEECMHTSNKIMNTHPRINDLTQLDIILLRSRIEFIRGTIAVKNNDLDMAITHMSYVIRLFTRKGSILQHYTNHAQRNTIRKRSSFTFSGSCRTSFPLSTTLEAATRRGLGFLPEAKPIQARCMPRLFSFNSIFPSSLLSKSTRPTHKQNRVQAEQTLEALDHINFYLRKASTLVKQINYVKEKEDEMHRHIQKLTQKSLETKHKRRTIFESLGSRKF
ncbi:unnamed protein product [Phytophthora fragariaefolia]|uniref:Unnamed protein product n=1 Tax=Phytophthora fragariaefolia TaxID=1490495 RepID=A0A9W6WMM4_9STRA|nr:unnamed protein product [Phytophthora fragariaefolia]